MSTDGQGTKCRRNIADNYNRLSRVHERYRQTDDRQTDGRQHYSEREREFTFANKSKSISFGYHQYTVSQKNAPTLTCYNLYIHGFGINVAEKVGNQTVLYFPTSSN